MAPDLGRGTTALGSRTSAIEAAYVRRLSATCAAFKRAHPASSNSWLPATRKRVFQSRDALSARAQLRVTEGPVCGLQGSPLVIDTMTYHGNVGACAQGIDGGGRDAALARCDGRHFETIGDHNAAVSERVAEQTADHCV